MGSVARVLLILCVVLGGCATERQVVLGYGSAPPDDLQVQRQVQQDIDRAPPVNGNRVDLLRDGAQAFPAMFDAIEHAQDSINMEYYTFEDVRSGGRTLGDVLVDRLRHGVAVQIIYDAIGSDDMSAAFRDRLMRAGALMVAFNADPLAEGWFHSPNDRDHRKIMVIDGRVGFMGGINLDPVYENPAPSGAASGDTERAYWRDTAIRITGPVVADLQRIFFDTWRQQNGPPLPPRNWFPPLAATDDETVRILAESAGRQQAAVLCLDAARSARRTSQYQSQYRVFRANPSGARGTDPGCAAWRGGSPGVAGSKRCRRRDCRRPCRLWLATEGRSEDLRSPACGVAFQVHHYR